MKTQANRHPHLLPLIIGITVILFGAAGFARIVGWMPNVSASFAQALASDRLPSVRAEPTAAIAHTTAAGARANARCAECGVIESTQEMQGDDADIGPAARSSESGIRSTGSRRITIRMSDGSTRVIDDPNAARWRPRERVIVIGGMDSNR